LSRAEPSARELLTIGLEALELEQKLPDVPHLQNPDRVAAAQVAHDELDMQLLILDDAFQHRRIVRDLDVVLLDALEPYGLGHVFPRGTLREPLSSLRRADVVALSRADAVTAKRREEIRAKIHRFAPEATWIELEHRPQYLLAATGERATLDELRGKSVAAFCGIGNPAGFRHTPAGSGANVTAWREFPDHHNYDRADIEELGAWLQEQPEVEVAVCTHKDLVKIGVPRLTGKPLYALVIGVGVSAGAEDLGLQLQQIASQIERPRRSR